MGGDGANYSVPYTHSAITGSPFVTITRDFSGESEREKGATNATQNFRDKRTTAQIFFVQLRAVEGRFNTRT
jgi:hypothetical protein